MPATARLPEEPPHSCRFLRSDAKRTANQAVQKIEVLLLSGASDLPGCS